MDSLEYYDAYIKEYKGKEKGWLLMIQQEHCSGYPNSIKERNIEILEKELKSIRCFLTKATNMRKKLKENE